MKKYAFPVLRYGLALVFIWFGYTQLKAPGAWAGLIPDWITNLSGLKPVVFVKMNAIAEIILAILLIVGIQVRLVAALLGLHLLSIVAVVGINPTGVRDIGLFFGMLAIFLNGSDDLCFDPTLRVSASQQEEPQAQAMNQ